MPSIRGAISRSRSTRSLSGNKASTTTKQTIDNNSNNKSKRKSQPPLKRRRILHHSSTATSDSSFSSSTEAESDEAVAASSSTNARARHGGKTIRATIKKGNVDSDASETEDEPPSSSEHDDQERDSDYINDKSGDEDQTTPKAVSRFHGHTHRANVISFDASSDISMSDDPSTSSSSSSSPVKTALGNVQVNSLKYQQRGGRGGKTSEQIQKKAKVAARKPRDDPQVIQSVNRFPPSPVKFLPNIITRRGFQVRPDAPNPFALDLPSRSTAAQHRANGTRATATIQAGFRRLAGRVFSRGMGITGGSKSSAVAKVATHHAQKDELATSVNGKRKRDDGKKEYPREEPRRRASVSDKQKRHPSTHAVDNRNQTTHHSGPTENLDFSSLQPIRRTRSLARQIEKLGIPASQAYSDIAEEPVASTSRIVEDTDEDETESVERSIAEMSLDEITENGEEEEDEQEAEEEEEDQEDAHLLNEASVPQLHRLRKDHLLRLVSMIQHQDDEQDRSDYTKDQLVKMILDKRDETADEEEDEQNDEAQQDAEEEEDEDCESSEAEAPQRQILAQRNNGSSRRTSSNSNHNKTASSPKHRTISAPTSSPHRRLRRQGGRSKSFNEIIESSSSTASSSSSDNDEVPSSPPQQQTHQRRRTGSGIGLGRPGGGARSSVKFSNTEKTPGRLRSGKLRQPSTVISSSDAEKENQFGAGSKSTGGIGLRRTTSRTSSMLEDEGDDEEEDDEDAATPIARRTRHRRNISTTSAASSAGGFGDDEDGQNNGMANREYRLRKISLPRRTSSISKAKRNNVVEVSESDEEDELDEEAEEEEEEGEDEDEEDGQEESLVDHGEEVADDEEEEEEVDDEEVNEHENEIDLASATKARLLRLRRDVLVQLCQERDLDDAGTKQELATALLAWYAENGQEEEEVDELNTSSEDGLDDDDNEEQEEEEEEDGDFEPADVSMETISSSTTSVRTSSSSCHSAATARARNETKTQALAKISNKRQSYNKGSGNQKPLLLKSDKSKAALIHSTRPNTPPGSGDNQENDLELDLESLNLLDKEIPYEKLTKGEKIGSGGFKDVYEGKYRNIKVALADIRGHLTENDLKELGLLRDLRHENIVRFIGVSIPTQRDVPVTIVSELCSNGDLFDYIRNVPAPPLEKILSIMLNIAKGLDYLHKRKPATIHRDMKSSNVLITARGVAKISDFGLARVRNSTRSIIKSLVGTVNWQAPELWVPHPRYNEKVDVYSSAMVFWECLQWHLSQKRYPFEGMNEHAIYQEVGFKKMRPSTATMRRQWGGDILDLIEKMWHQNPASRPTMSQVVEELEIMLKTEKARARAAAAASR